MRFDPHAAAEQAAHRRTAARITDEASRELKGKQQRAQNAGKLNIRKSTPLAFCSQTHAKENTLCDKFVCLVRATSELRAFCSISNSLMMLPLRPNSFACKHTMTSDAANGTTCNTPAEPTDFASASVANRSLSVWQF